MGEIWNGVKDGFKNLITGGGHRELQGKILEFEEAKQELRELHEAVEKKKIITNQKLLALVKVKKKALLALKKINKISKNFRGKDREFQETYLEKQSFSGQLDSINNTITLGEAAINASKGVAGGVSTALGSWALVSTFGAASTGTGLISLSGVAATNATLAWFGGGAVAVGGGGMAAGTAVLGGIVVIPAMVIWGVFNYVAVKKKIKEVETAKLEARRMIGDQKKMELAIEMIGRRSDELQSSTEKARKTFLHEYRKTYTLVYPLFFISKIIKFIKKKLFNKNYFSDKDLRNIHHLVNVASEFKILIDQKIIDVEGRLL